MKTKVLKILLSFSLALSIVSVTTKMDVAHATDFTGKEREYIAKCNQSKMSNEDIAVCQEFNDYLKQQNDNIKKDISETETDLTNTKEDLNDVLDQITEYENQIALQEDQIEYFNSNIATLEASIAQKSDELKERMYLMQDYVNVNVYIDFIVKASSISDLFSRIESIVDITGSDKELITSLQTQKQSLQEQKELVESSKSVLEELKTKSDEKKSELETLASEYEGNLADLYAQNDSYEESLASMESAIKSSIANQQEIAAAQAAAAAAAAAAEAAAKKAAEEAAAKKAAEEAAAAQAAAAKKAAEEAAAQQAADAAAKAQAAAAAQQAATQAAQAAQQAAANEQAAEQKASSATASAAAQGAVNYALARVGYSYVLGTTGPSSYDCSGLCMMAYRSVGIEISRTTYTQCVRGTAVSWDNLLPGDLLFWVTLPGAQPSHVGMYIGNGLMVHAATPSLGVIVSNIDNDYWKAKLYCIRRMA